MCNFTQISIIYLNFISNKYFLSYQVLKSKVEKNQFDGKIHMIYEIDVEYNAEFKFVIHFNIKLIFFEILIFFKIIF